MILLEIRGQSISYACHKKKIENEMERTLTKEIGDLESWEEVEVFVRFSCTCKRQTKQVNSTIKIGESLSQIKNSAQIHLLAYATDFG